MTETQEQAAPTSASALLTFLVADIRGFTAYTDTQGDEAGAALSERFLALCREVVSSFGGEVFGSAGDQALAAFSSARSALRAALALQKRLGEEQGAHPELPLSAGIGLDTGDAVRVGADYRGGAINLAARLQSLAGKGEIFASEGVIRSARATDGVAFVDRGAVQLKGIQGAVRVLQVGEEGKLPDQLPPLQPLLVTHPNNLPDEPTPFIGREGEIRAIRELMAQPGVRMVTLTGVGGTGKTRLALQVGASLLSDYQDGVFFVNLAPLSDPALVPSAIAEVLGVREESGKDLVATLATFLTTKHMLLVLDNFEQVLPAASAVATLLDRCRQLHVLVTSRVLLHLSREHDYPVPPLSVPDPRHLPDLATLAQCEAVALFVQRARAVKPDFAVTAENARVITEICARLDGLPLAIELAAARLRLFPPQALLSRLEHRLPLLTGGARDLPARQQTLRNALDWSYGLLDESEQRLFMRLAVFAGGWALEAAEAVCNPAGDLDVLAGLESLVDKSLVRAGEGPGGDARFSMLHIVREYGLERLSAAGEAEQTAQRHADCFVRFAEEGRAGLEGQEQATWLARFDAEQDNCRAALGYTLLAADAERALRLSGALAMLYWYGHGDWQEGRLWLEQALAVPETHTNGRRHDDMAVPAGADLKGPRAHALVGLANLCQLLNDFEPARAHAREALQLGQELNDPWVITWANVCLAWVVAWEGDLAGARELAERALVAARQGASEWTVANALHIVGAVAVLQKDHEVGQAYLRESVERHRALHDHWALGYELNTLGDSYRLQGSYPQARTHYEEALRWFQEGRIRGGVASILHNLGYVSLHEGDCAQADEQFRAALTIFQELGDRRGVAECAIGLGAVAVVDGQPERAARLFAAGQRTLADVGSVLSHSNDADYEHYLSILQTQLDGDAYQTAWQAGASMSFEQLVDYAGHPHPPAPLSHSMGEGEYPRA